MANSIWHDWLGFKSPRATIEEQPLRAELFSLEQLQRHGAALAAQHQITTRRGRNQLLHRLAESEEIIHLYNLKTVRVEKNRRITPASEWLIDNFYVIKEQIQIARRHLPRSYNRELPRLINGPCAGLPRVYDIALELISHMDGRIDVEHLSAFVAAYQSVAELRLGELWAIPIMLRLALIENLRRVAIHLGIARQDRDLADSWADQMIAMVEKNPSNLVLVVSDMAKSNPSLSSAFVAEFCHRLQGQNPTVQFARHWLEQRLIDHGLTLEGLVNSEGQRQAADQVSIGNSITSLRLLSAIDWREFVESLSVVEQSLRQDPAGIHAKMDFATRDRYRHIVEKMARHSSLSEKAVAEKAIELSRQARASGNKRAEHAGFFLIDKGAPQLEESAGVRWPLKKQILQLARRFPLAVYLTGLLGITLGLAAWTISSQHVSSLPGWKLVLFSILLVVCLSQFAISLINWAATLFATPRLLPRLDFSEEIPSDHRTVVVVPTMLGNRPAIDKLLEHLEIHYLANRAEHLHFALLTDFMDAAEEILPSDEPLLRHAREGVIALNEKYRRDRPGIFFLLHRPRRWNEAEKQWMGYERKRGKLAEFNALLRNGRTDRFLEIVGALETLQSVRHVITLDTDTQLPRDTARQLIGTIAHPLNRPYFDPVKGRVCEGYGILQPRVAVSLPSASRSWFVRLFAADAGVDPYTRAVSDVYQDVFDEGSFIGKGIYDVEAFEQAVGGRFPENTVLSHDLLESCHARSGLISDIQLFEEHPSRYHADVNRRHRWIRGDWQISAWLLPRVPGPDARRIENPLSWLSKWKILDNLRRSLVPIALTLLLISAWCFFPDGRGFWTLFVMAVIAAQGFSTVAVELVRKPEELPWAMHLDAVAGSFLRQLAMAAFTLVFLPYDAYVSADAIVRTLTRMWVTRRRLLEWQTSHDAELNARTDIVSFFQSMWMAPVLAIAIGAELLYRYPQQLAYASFLLGLWCLSPVVAWWISRPLEAKGHGLSEDQLLFLRRAARKTWRFFETFVGPDDNWLPPDNFQEHPAPLIASRTSPTNIGMAALSTLVAADFGYISPGTLVSRIQKTFDTLDGLDRYRGHFYNWYDTRSLKPLLPLYISSVDSGNFAGHLLTLAPGLEELASQKVFTPVAFHGIADTLSTFEETVKKARHADKAHTESGVWKSLEKAIALFWEQLQNHPTSASATHLLLTRLETAADKIVEQTPELNHPELTWWSNAIAATCREHRTEIENFVPWVKLPSVPHPLSQRASDRRPYRLNELHELLRRLDHIPTLEEAARFDQNLLPLIALIIENLRDKELQEPDIQWLTDLQSGVAAASFQAKERLATVNHLALKCREFAEMDFQFLYDSTRELFSIGFNVSDHRLDASFYDLLASEARLTSFVAIALRQVSQEHWFSLGRVITSTGGAPSLISWSGSMFEYLMPLLVMPNYEHTLLDQTYKAAVSRQIEYGRQRGVPWGVSESGYNLTDVHLNYQYRAFGVPGLGLKRGLAEDLVIAPYASAMGLMVAPLKACENLQRLQHEGREGKFGFYEAIDYTPSRIPPGQTSVTLRSFMAHHQGMSFLSFAYLLLDRPMQRRFDANPLFKSADLLLQERLPKSIAPLFPDDLEEAARVKSPSKKHEVLRLFTNPNQVSPEVHLLSNGRYHLMVSSAGGGSSRWKELAVTRWREDPTRDCWGSFCYLRDLQTRQFWSNTYQPTLRPAKFYEALFSQARAEFKRRDENIDCHTEISVSPEDDIELRRLTLTNRSRHSRLIELTSFAEIVLAAPAADAAHPAFSNLFVQTEILAEQHAILCTRRARSRTEKPPYFFHLMRLHGTESGHASYETDRSIFIGRGRSAASPAALHKGHQLSNSAGSVLDPIVAIRRNARIAADDSVQVDIISGMAETREMALALIHKYQDKHIADRVMEMSWTHSQVVLRHLNATETDAQLFGRLAGALFYTSPHRRAPTSSLLKNNRGQSNLWGYGISGDLPLVLVHLTDSSRLQLVKQMINAHSYWRMKGVSVDLVVLTEDSSVYRQSLHDEVIGLVPSTTGAQMLDKPGGIFIRREEQFSPEDRILLQTVARIVLLDKNGSLAEQVDRRYPETSIPRLIPVKQGVLPTRTPTPQIEAERPALIFDNGLGGFTPDGREYVISLPAGKTTPLPWINVLANPQFGTVVSESGSAYTWAENCHELRLTTWHNDPISDTTGEAFYIRDDQSGEFWSPTALPARGKTPYVTRHGFGYSVFEHVENGIKTELTIFAALDAPVKFAQLKIKNVSGRPRKMSATGYWEWVLGELRHKSLPHLVTEIDPRSGALLVRNPFNTDFPGRIAFVDVQEPSRMATADRAEFLGRNGTLAAPAALGRLRLSGKVGAGLDACAAFMVTCDLADQQEKQIIFRVGLGRDAGEVQQLLQKYRSSESCRKALEQVKEYWTATLGSVRVETPDPALDVLANGWLLYQTLCCRVWARTGFYQSGGAFGFRDQLQDCMALIHSEPRLLREHILRAAAHQFREGDVQHWWHPPQDRGVRTHFSDDYLWLPFATCRYVFSLHDTGVLDERIPFLEGRPVKPEEEAYYDLPRHAGETATLYEHCVRAINNGLKFGAHGLPLIGCGDWNDGMNLIGEHGRGESVWLAFFLYDVLIQFAELARRRNDTAFAEHCTTHAAQLKENIESNAWDGDWYRRAYFDDGTPLGSAQNSECQIDSLPQSWAIISRAGNPARAAAGMTAVDKRLVRRDARLIQLFDPPFDTSSLNPGYIKGYVPGVRENGGQYTHGAIWTIMAFALQGNISRAWELFAMINPVHHGSSSNEIDTYKVEPYVMAADIYAVAPHTGRGGWTWYTGSAGWTYRLITETLLGLRLEGDQLHLEPRVPRDWKSYKIHYRYRQTTYHITIRNSGEASSRPRKISLDGAEQSGPGLQLVDDRQDHQVDVQI